MDYWTNLLPTVRRAANKCVLGEGEASTAHRGKEGGREEGGCFSHFFLQIGEDEDNEDNDDDDNDDGNANDNDKPQRSIGGGRERGMLFFQLFFSNRSKLEEK